MNEADGMSNASTKTVDQLTPKDIVVIEPKAEETGFLSMYDMLIAMGFSDEMLRFRRDITRLKSCGWIVDNSNCLKATNKK